MVLLYEEGLDVDTVNGVVNATANADLLIVAGTSLMVYPTKGGEVLSRIIVR
jgi:NAD-dependent deacetylase